MKKQSIEIIAEQLVVAALDAKTLPINTGENLCWQDFAMLSDADAEELAKESNIRVTGTIYETGNISLTIAVPTTHENEDTMRDAYKTLKAKNLVLVSIERAGEAKRADNESTELLEKAADMLGVTPEQALEMVNKKEENNENDNY